MPSAGYQNGNWFTGRHAGSPYSPPAGDQLLDEKEVFVYPNPVKGREAIIHYRLRRPATVSIRVYDVTGRMVRTLTSEMMPAGEHRAVWDGTAEDGRQVGAGIYFYSSHAGDHTETQKLIMYR